jgi:choline monooxygenase
MENYHVFALHPQLTRFAPMHTRSPGEFEGHCFVNQYTFPVLDAGRGLDLPHFPDLSENASKIGMWFLLFPTLGIEIFPDQLTIFQVDPVAPDLTRETIHVYLIGDAAHSDEHAEARQEVFDMWGSLNHEDLGILERLQAGRASPSYTGGLFSPAWERVTLEISRLVARGVNLGHDGDR